MTKHQKQTEQLNFRANLLTVISQKLTKAFEDADIHSLMGQPPVGRDEINLNNTRGDTNICRKI